MHCGQETILTRLQKGNSGKWQVPKNEGSTKPKADAIEPGDIGIWVTCPLHMKGKAAREMELLFDDVCGIYGHSTETWSLNFAVRRENVRDQVRGRACRRRG